MKSVSLAVALVLSFAGCASFDRGTRAEKISVFDYVIERVVRERGVSYEIAGAMLRKGGVYGFDTAYDYDGMDNLLRTGLKPVNFYGDVDFLAADQGAAKADEFIASAVRYGAKVIMIIPGNFTGKADRDDEARRMIPGLKAMVEKAIAAGLLPTMEDAGASVGNPTSYRKYLTMFMDEVPDLRLALDSGNLSYANRGDDILLLMRHCRGRVGHVHLKDFAEAGPTRKRATLGYGVIPNREIIEYVKREGYDGWYTIEHAVGPDAYDDVIRQAALINVWGPGSGESTGYSNIVDEGFEYIFNGKDLTGWHGATTTYGVLPDEPGVLQCLPRHRDGKEGEGGHLCTRKQYRNFILRFEFCMPTNGNNGVGIRMPDTVHESAYYGMCEVQLVDDNKPALKPEQFTGAIYGIKGPKTDNTGLQVSGNQKNFSGKGSYARVPGMWNFAEIRVAGEEIEVYLNGYLINKADLSGFRGDGDTVDGKLHPGLHNRRGYIGWLGHGHNVKWRNIRVRELPDDMTMAELNRANPEPTPCGFTAQFTGRVEDLCANWKGVTTKEKFNNPDVRAAASPEKRAEIQRFADDQMRAHWFVRNGNLYFDGFEGGYSLATKRDYADFELWADWRLMSVTGDSGLYLRGTPQVQIWDAHNQWHIGSGGLYNNEKNPSNALKIADRQIGDWNRFHVIMRDDRVSVWLNGELVTDNVILENRWDRNKPIYESGQIELQCHGDPIEFRNIFIRELPEAK